MSEEAIEKSKFLEVEKHNTKDGEEDEAKWQEELKCPWIETKG
jgi:hypothetical protein